MGNRANVIFKQGKEYSPTVYLHWNGGVESVMAFLLELKSREDWGHDVSYSAARFVGVVAEFFRGHGKVSDSGLSLGIMDSPKSLADIKEQAPGDNGYYIVDLDASELTVKHNSITVTEKNLGAQLKRAGQGYTDPNIPKEKFRHIQQFFKDQRTLLESFEKGGAK